METDFFIETLPLFRNSGGKLLQAIRIRLEGGKTGGPCRLSLHAQGWRRTFALSGGEPGTPLQVTVPAIETATECDCRLTLGDAAREKRVTLAPRRRWEIHVQNFTHTDIGYTDLPSRVAKGYREALKSILRYCDETTDYPPESIFRWNVETGYWLENAVAGLEKRELARFRSLVRKGRVELTPLYVAHTSEFNDEETLVRSLYFAFDFARRSGASIRCAMASDSTGQPWILPPCLSRCGVRYFSTAVNATMAKAPKLPRPFYWGSRDGSRILVLDTDERQAYQEGVMVGLTEDRATMERKLPAYLLDLEENGGYPFDLLALRTPGYPGDNTQPNLAISRNVKSWNEKWEYPRLLVSTYTPFFEELERRYGERIPTHVGAWPDWWVLYHGATAFETGVNRNTHAELHAAERLSVVAKAGRAKSFSYPKEALRDVYRTMIIADEADWGAYSSVSEPDSLQTRGQRAENQAFVFQAAINSQALAECARGALARFATSRTGKGVMVTNASGWCRSEVVFVSVPEAILEGKKGVRIRDAETGETADAQVIEVQTDRPALRVAFRADDVPALGFKTYSLEPGPEEPEEELREGRCGNGFYDVSWDPRTGAIEEIRDAESGVNLVDADSPYRWNQLLYETPETPRTISLRAHMGLPKDLLFLQPYYRSLHDFYDYPPKGARLLYSSPSSQRLLGAKRGRLFTEIAAASSMELFPDFTCRVILDNCFKRIRLVSDVSKTETLQAEGVYIAFPFRAGRPTVRVSCHGGWFQPEKEQLPGSSKDWYCVQKWIDLQGDGFHVTWSPLEAPLVQLGALSTGRWRDELSIDNGTIFSFVMNNYWWTNSPASQGGRFRFRYALTSGQGPFEPVSVNRFGHDAHLPLSATVIERRGAGGRCRGSFLAADLPGNAMLVGMKEEERGEGIILRFLETGGEETTFPLMLSGRRIRRASLVTPVEELIRPLKVGRTGVPIVLKPFELATVRVEA